MMDRKIHHITPFGKDEIITFVEHLLFSACVVLVAAFWLERHGIGLRDVVLGWLFIQVSWRGMVTDVLFSWHHDIILFLKNKDESEEQT